MHLDSHYVLSSLYYSQGKVRRFLDQSDKYLSLLKRVKQKPGEFGLMVHNTIRHEWRIRLHRGFAFTKRGEKEKAGKEYSVSLKMCDDKSEYYKERSAFYLKRSECESADQFLQKALKYNPDSKELQKAELELHRKMEIEEEQIYEDPKFAGQLEMFTQSFRSNFPERNVEQSDLGPFLVYSRKGFKISVSLYSLEYEDDPLLRYFTFELMR